MLTRKLKPETQNLLSIIEEFEKMMSKAEIRNRRLTAIGIVAGMIAGLFGGIGMIGSPLTTAGMLTILTGGMMAGASLTAFIVQGKLHRKG